MADEHRRTPEEDEHLTKLEEALFEIRRVIAGQEEMQVLNVVTAPQTDVSRASAAA